jgi:GntR family transcriptional regulator
MARHRYQEIAEDLERLIESGELPKGTYLPTEGELTERYDTSRSTVRQAVTILVDKRLLEPTQGKGTYIPKELETFVTTLSTDPKTGLAGVGEEGNTYPATVQEQDRRAGASEPTAETVKCPAKIADRLQIPANGYVVKRRQQRYIDDTVWSMQESYYPLDWVTKGAKKLQFPEDIAEGTVNYLAEFGLKQVGYRDLIAARMPTEEEQDLFDLKRNHTVIEAYRTSFTADGTAIRVTVTVFPADRNQLVYDMGEVPDRREGPVRP